MRATLVALSALSAIVSTAAAQTPTRNPHGTLRQPCADCHAPEGWTPARISGAFDHGKTGFALAGAHIQTSCRSCHASLDFKGAGRTCAGCHADVHRGELGLDCARCHTTRSFIDRGGLARGHQETRFPLTGSHLAVDCTGCHTPTPQGRLTFVSHASDCVDCHRAEYQATRSPDHQAGGLSTNCTQCHATTTWPRARFSHAGTAFPLTGAHRAVACAECHGDGVYDGTSEVCAVCHQLAYNATTNPGHQAAGFSTNCTQCHSTAAWIGATFDHAGTAFPLTGAHVTAACAQCHGDGVYAGKSAACVSCHQADYDAAANPNHTASLFPTDCASCHSTSTWGGARFTLHDASSFPIYSGSHRGKWTTCSACHQTAGNFTQFTCLTCHEHRQSEMDGKHQGENGYAYNSPSCYSCHRRP